MIDNNAKCDERCEAQLEIITSANFVFERVDIQWNGIAGSSQLSWKYIVTTVASREIGIMWYVWKRWKTLINDNDCAENDDDGNDEVKTIIMNDNNNKNNMVIDVESQNHDDDDDEDNVDEDDNDRRHDNDKRDRS